MKPKKSYGGIQYSLQRPFVKGLASMHVDEIKLRYQHLTVNCDRYHNKTFHDYRREN